MPSCLGLYIENNVIKYAKVSKERDDFKVESFGMKFYDNIDETVKQIVNETYSYKVPISTNLSNEKYISTKLFSLLNQKDLNKAAKTEFELFCNEKNRNYNALEYRNIFIPDLEDKEKVISLFSYTDKSDVAEKLQVLSGYKVSSISPLPISIQNLINNTDVKNKVIVNIEKKTSVTFIVNNNVYNVETIDIGMKEIFDNIIKKENSYAKAYEICKNTTIYTMQGRNLQIEENEYMEDIMPTLYNIVENIKEVIAKSNIKVDEIYITGLVAAINNIDLYFQENFINAKCEILAPFFVKKSNIKLNIRDYIEVNSAIALALQGLGVGNREVDFKHKAALEKNKSETNKSLNISAQLKNLFKPDFNKSFDKIEKNLLRFTAGLLVLFISYIIISNIIINKINKKEVEILGFISDSKTKISETKNNTKLIKDRTEQYNEMIRRIDEENDRITQSYARKNIFPNFLTEIMFNIPKEVQLVSIENTTGKIIRIKAKSKGYEQLGYFIAKIKNEAILTDVTSTSGEKQDGFVVVTIQGNLPF